MSIVIKNLTKIYNNKKILDNISFKIKKGEIVGLLGVNGAGIAGQSGRGHGAGEGGIKVNTGELLAQGVHDVGRDFVRQGYYSPGGRSLYQGTPGGKISSCTQGMYWREQGVGPCETVGVGKFKNALG